MFAFGVVLSELINGDGPWGKKDTSELSRTFVQAVIQGNRPPRSIWKGPKEVIDLMEKCWSQNPHDRPEFDWIVDYLLRNENVICSYTGSVHPVGGIVNVERPRLKLEPDGMQHLKILTERYSGTGEMRVLGLLMVVVNRNKQE